MARTGTIVKHTVLLINVTAKALAWYDDCVRRGTDKGWVHGSAPAQVLTACRRVRQHEKIINKSKGKVNAERKMAGVRHRDNRPTQAGRRRAR